MFDWRGAFRGLGYVSDAERARMSPEAADRLQGYRASQRFGDLMGDLADNAPTVQTRRAPRRQMRSPLLGPAQGPAVTVRRLGQDDEQRKMLAQALERY